ncbi:hypothetical protein D3C87_1555030 [compost metagenome]
MCTRPSTLSILMSPFARACRRPSKACKSMLPLAALSCMSALCASRLMPSSAVAVMFCPALRSTLCAATMPTLSLPEDRLTASGLTMPIPAGACSNRPGCFKPSRTCLSRSWLAVSPGVVSAARAASARERASDKALSNWATAASMSSCTP